MDPWKLKIYFCLKVNKTRLGSRLQFKTIEFLITENKIKFQNVIRISNNLFKRI